jgi:hypothetical protein
VPMLRDGAACSIGDEPGNDGRASVKAERVGRRRELASRILAWIGDRPSFRRDDLYDAFSEVRRCELGPALNRAQDELRNQGVEYGPSREEPGVLVRLTDDARIVRRSLRFAARGRRIDRRAAAIAACAPRPERLPPVLKRAHESAVERAGIAEASHAAQTARRRLPGC